MQIVVKATTREAKQARGRTYWGVKHTDGNWYNIITDNKPIVGQIIEAEVKTNEYQGKTYRWAEVKKQAVAQTAQNNGKALSWWDYSDMMQRAHDKAKELEPDDPQSRAALVNTVMIAFTNGKVELPKEEDEVPPPTDDDIPF